MLQQNKKDKLDKSPKFYDFQPVIHLKMTLKLKVKLFNKKNVFIKAFKP